MEVMAKRKRSSDTFKHASAHGPATHPAVASIPADLRLQVEQEAGRWCTWGIEHLEQQGLIPCDRSSTGLVPATSDASEMLLKAAAGMRIRRWEDAGLVDCLVGLPSSADVLADL